MFVLFLGYPLLLLAILAPFVYSSTTTCFGVDVNELSVAVSDQTDVIWQVTGDQTDLWFAVQLKFTLNTATYVGYFIADFV